MNSFNEYKNTWILRGDSLNITNPGNELVYRNIESADSVYLPDTCKYLSYGNNCICFVTYDDLYSIKFQQFWFGKQHEEFSFVRFNAEINFNSNKWPERKIDNRIVDLKTTNDGLFALVVSADGDLLLYKWKAEKDGFDNEYLLVKIKIPDIDSYRDDTTPKILISTMGLQNIVIVYNIPQGVFIGKFNDGARVVQMEEIKTFRSCKDSIVLSLEESNINENSKILKIWGVEFKKKRIFKLDYAISKTGKSKFKEYGFNVVDKNFSASNIIDIRISNVMLFYNPKKNLYHYNKFIFLCTNSPNLIYVSHANVEINKFFPLIYNIDDDMFNFSGIKEIALSTKCSELDTIEVINDQLMIFGSSNCGRWNAYYFPYYRNKSQEKKHYCYDMDNLVDS